MAKYSNAERRANLEKRIAKAKLENKLTVAAELTKILNDLPQTEAATKGKAPAPIKVAATPPTSGARVATVTPQEVVEVMGLQRAINAQIAHAQGKHLETKRTILPATGLARAIEANVRDAQRS